MKEKAGGRTSLLPLSFLLLWGASARVRGSGSARSSSSSSVSKAARASGYVMYISGSSASGS